MPLCRASDRWVAGELAHAGRVHRNEPNLEANPVNCRGCLDTGMSASNNYDVSEEVFHVEQG